MLMLSNMFQVIYSIFTYALTEPTLSHLLLSKHISSQMWMEREFSRSQCSILMPNGSDLQVTQHLLFC